MRNNGFFVFATCCLLVFSATSCQKIKGIFGKKKSSTTGWTYNDSKNGGIEYNNVKAQKQAPDLYSFREELSLWDVPRKMSWATGTIRPKE